jgi:outer membrane protein OmpA-like peptidoglycan-associated protein
MNRERGTAATCTRGLVTAICLVLGVTGCTLGDPHQARPGLPVTEGAVPSAFVAVVPGAGAGPSLARLIAATIRPDEDIDVLQAGATATVLAAGTAPAPTVVTVPGRPAQPGAGATSFLEAKYHQGVGHWLGEVSSARLAAAARTRSALAAWVGSLDVAGKVGRLRPASGATASLASECAIAASALAGLDQTAGASFGNRRVILLYTPMLSGSPPAGELTGDDVIVITPFLPSASALAAAQASLLASGATRATILGPESTATELIQAVTSGLSQRAVTETLSGTALFANDSARLLPGAVRVLAPVIAPLRKPGAAAVINGYASTPGGSGLNYQLSYARATAVAAFLEAHGIPASCLDIVGHGASDLVARGSSGANRRVVIVVEQPEVP